MAESGPLPSVPDEWHSFQPSHTAARSTHVTVSGSSGSGGQSPRPVVPPKPLSRQGGGGGGGGELARNTGSHCGGTTATGLGLGLTLTLTKTGWLASANLRGGGSGEGSGGKSGCAKAHTWSSWLRVSKLSGRLKETASCRVGGGGVGAGGGECTGSEVNLDGGVYAERALFREGQTA